MAETGTPTAADQLRRDMERLRDLIDATVPCDRLYSQDCTGCNLLDLANYALEAYDRAQAGG